MTTKQAITTTNNGSNNRQDRELDKLTWALAKADMQALAIRLDAVIKVGSEANLTVVRRVIRDLKNATDNIHRDLGLGDAAPQEGPQ